MSCPQCGNPAAVSRGTCAQCNRAGGGFSIDDAEKTKHAGYEAGHGLVMGLHWLMTNRYLSYLWFWLIWVITSYVLGHKFGWIGDDWDKNRPFAFDVVSVILPIGIVVVFRKQVAKYLPMLFERLLQLAAWLIIALVCVFLGMCVWNTVT